MWMPLLIFAQIVKKATCLMTTKQYNSSNILTPNFKWTSFEKRNDLDELINIPIKAEERSMIQISFRTQDLNVKTGTILNRTKIHSWLRSTVSILSPRIRSIHRKNPRSMCFFKPKSVCPKTHSAPSIYTCMSDISALSKRMLTLSKSCDFQLKNSTSFSGL